MKVESQFMKQLLFTKCEEGQTRNSINTNSEDQPSFLKALYLG